MPVELQKAFPVCRAKVFRHSDEENADCYSVLSAGNGRVILEALRERLQNNPPKSGQKVFVQSLLSDAAYRMPARVVDCIEGNTIRLIVEQMGEIRHIERRRYFRVKTELPIRVVDRSVEDAEEQILVSRDISAGGASIISGNPVPEGHELSITIDLRDGHEPFKCAAAVVRCRPYGKDRYELGLSFRDVSERDADRLVEALLKIARAQINP